MPGDPTSPNPRTPFKRESWIEPAEAVIVWLVFSALLQGVFSRCCGPAHWERADFVHGLVFFGSAYVTAGVIRSKVFFFEVGCLVGLFVVLNHMPVRVSTPYLHNLLHFGLPWFFVIMAYGCGSRFAAMLRHWLIDHRKLRRLPQCDVCGYLLYGLTEPRCPECGSAFEKPIPSPPS